MKDSFVRIGINGGGTIGNENKFQHVGVWRYSVRTPQKSPVTHAARRYIFFIVRRYPPTGQALSALC